MTVCIAAISENDNLLAVADKKLTTNGGVTSAYEISENKKIVQLTPTCVALFAGNITEANQLLKLAKISINDTDSITDIANKVQAAYAERLRIGINMQLLQKFGLDLNAFMAQQRSLDPTFVSSMVETINHANLGVEILTAGRDTTGPQLFKMNVAGTLEDCTPIGYASIGSGSNHAHLSLIESEYHAGADKAKSVYSIIKAKQRAEYDPNVGHMSSMVLIGDEIQFLEDTAIDQLWKEYDKAVVRFDKVIQKSSSSMREVVYGANN